MTMMANPWGEIGKDGGAWADKVEEEVANGGAGILGGDTESFPTLGEAVKETHQPGAKKKGKEKKAKQTMSLAVFQTSGSNMSVAALRSSLPTAPLDRGDAPDDDRRGGRGFGFDGGRDREDRNRDRPRREDMGPSKADEASDWGAGKRFTPSDSRDYNSSFGGSRGGGFRDRDGGDFRSGGGFRDREGGFRDRDGMSGRRDDGPSRADEADSWGNRSGGGGFDDRRPGAFESKRGGFGYEERREERRGGFRSRDFDSRADAQDTWARSDGGGDRDAFDSRRGPGERDRRPGFGFGGGDSADRWARKPEDITERAPEAAAPRTERPKLNLTKRSVPLSEKPAEQPAARSSIFGAARPREEVLKEQGRDWLKEDLQLQHKAVEREETDEEKQLKKEVEELQSRVEAGEGDVEYEPSSAPEDDSAAESARLKTVRDVLEEKEAELQALQAKLDDAVRFAKDHARDREREHDREHRDRGWDRDREPRQEKPFGRGPPSARSSDAPTSPSRKAW